MLPLPVGMTFSDKNESTKKSVFKYFNTDFLCGKGKWIIPDFILVK